LGGALPYIIGRLDHQTQVLRRGPTYLKRAPSEYLRQVWFDMVSPLPPAMRFAYELLSPDRLLYASDHPWVDPATIRSALESLNLPAVDRAKILGGNARRLFNL
jgi:predicted TIM-barrel fold metal-dependent hydrolase